jgi:hypothetical protein
MRRRDLEHIIRAAADIADDDEIIIIGSQAILGQYPDAPAELCVSVEADVYPKNRPERADLIDGFHSQPTYPMIGTDRDTDRIRSRRRSRRIETAIGTDRNDNRPAGNKDRLPSRQ